MGESGLHTGYTDNHCYLAVFSVRYALLATKRFFIVNTDLGEGMVIMATVMLLPVTAQQGLLGYDVLHFGIEMPNFQGKFCLHF